MKALHLLCALLLILPQLASAKPNVVVILTDDQGWGDLSLNGNANLETPNVDSLARDGAMFDRFYVCPVCSPTRAEFLTGRYHPRSNVYSTSAGGERMDLDEVTIADTFRAGGYATGAFGKWHNGEQYPYHPNARGFDEYYGFCAGHWGDYFSPLLERNGEYLQGDGFVIDDFTNQAMAFMEEQVKADKPFFAYLPYNTPHSPMQVPDPYWEKFKSKELPLHHRDPEKEDNLHVRSALAMCENIDWNVGRVLAKLDDLGVAEDTIVIYFCDNGPNGWRWNGDMKGKKGSTDEGGVRSPLLVRWPAKIAGGKEVTQLGAAIDLLPTLAEMAGIDLISEKPLDGVSLASALVDGAKPSDGLGDRMIVSHWKGKTGVRTPQYRLDNTGQLFDMSADPGQREDIAKSKPKVAAKLKKVVKRFEDEVASELVLPDPRPFVIGHPDARWTPIPARDGTAHGTIERSNKFPNCSYFRNWTSLEDKITWAVDVGAPGTFDVELHYTCAEDAVGTEMELSLGDRRVAGTVVKAHNPPEKGGENDRSPRGESYVKDFAVMKLGTIELEKGAGELTLRAVKKPGERAIDFRLLTLERK